MQYEQSREAPVKLQNIASLPVYLDCAGTWCASTYTERRTFAFVPNVLSATAFDPAPRTERDERREQRDRAANNMD